MKIETPSSLRHSITLGRLNLKLEGYRITDAARGWIYRDDFSDLEDSIDQAHILIVHTIYEECKASHL